MMVRGSHDLRWWNVKFCNLMAATTRETCQRVSHALGQSYLLRVHCQGGCSVLPSLPSPLPSWKTSINKPQTPQQQSTSTKPQQGKIFSHQIVIKAQYISSIIDIKLQDTLTIRKIRQESATYSWHTEIRYVTDSKSSCINIPSNQ